MTKFYRFRASIDGIRFTFSVKGDSFMHAANQFADAFGESFKQVTVHSADEHTQRPLPIARQVSVVSDNYYECASDHK